MQSHKKLKMFLLGVTWKWKMYFFHDVNLKKKDDVKKQTFKYNNEKGKEKTVEFYETAII